MTVRVDQPGAGPKRKAGRPRVMTDEMRGRVKLLLEAGVPVVAVARKVGLDTSTIYKYRAELLAAEPGRATGAAGE